jgi:peptidoglycan/xylan/chitin deacetylase (PgdA/CDA1 family)
MEAHTAVEHMKRNRSLQKVKFPEPPGFHELLNGIETLENYDRAFEGRDHLAPRSILVLEKVPTGDNTVFLTFDDGPYAVGDGAHFSNEQLLSILKSCNARGTFFFQGPWSVKNAALVKKTVEEGHTIGNHTYHHPPDGCFMAPPCPQKVKLQRLDPAWQVKELLWCRAAMVTALDNDTKGLTPCFRAPHGSGVLSAPHRPADTSLLASIAGTGHIVINGNTSLSDARSRLTAPALVKAYRAHFKSTAPGHYKGEILWLHSGLKATADALPEIIGMLHQKGYRVEAIPVNIGR